MGAPMVRCRCPKWDETATHPCCRDRPSSIMPLSTLNIPMPDGAAVPRVDPPRIDRVVEAVRADLLARSQLGIKKYGLTLCENQASLRDRLQHAYEETLDHANYLKWAIMELDGK